MKSSDGTKNGMTRRNFAGTLFGTLAAVALSLNLSTCNKTNDIISNLRGILNAVEAVLKLLDAMSGLLPEAVNKGAAYLLAVLQFVDDVGRILEDEVTSATDKTRQILSWAAGLPMVDQIPEPPQKIIRAVAAAVDKFLSIFGTDAEHAGAAARSRLANVPNLDMSKHKPELQQIEKDAEADKGKVTAWQQKALVTPH